MCSDLWRATSKILTSILHINCWQVTWPSPCSEILFEKLTVAQLVKKLFLHETKRLFPRSQQAVNRPFIIHSVVYLTKVQWPLPLRVLHRARSSASSLNLKYPLVSLRSSSSSLRLLSRLPVTSTFPSIFPSITLFIRQFLRKIWPVQLNFLLFIIRT